LPVLSIVMLGTPFLVWTDVFVKRAGKWQVIASQDLEVMDK